MNLDFETIRKWFDREEEKWAWGLFAAGLAVFFGAISHWVVFEYDLFFMVRAGGEILAGQGVQTTDHWSHTIAGTPWYNFQWLTTAIYYLVSKLAPDYAAFSTMRAIFIGAWMFNLFLIARKASGKGLHAWLITLFVGAYWYLVCNFRLQMRADLIATYINSWLILTLLSDNLKPKTKRIVSIALIWLWANIHTGTVPIGILQYCAHTWFSNDLAGPARFKERIWWSGAGALVWLLTPIGPHIFGVIGKNVLEYDYEFTRNPDLQPFRLHLLRYNHGGYAISFWFVHTLFSVFAAWFFWRRQELLPAQYRNKAFFTLVGAALIYLCVNKIRGIHYNMVFFLPVTAAFLAHHLKRDEEWFFRLGVGMLAACAFMYGSAIPDVVRKISRPIGSGVYDKELPVHAARFIRETRPAGKLHNTPAFGGFLINETPDYPVSIDSRDFPFIPFLREQSYAMQNGALYQDFLAKYGINLVVEYLPNSSYDPQRRRFVDPHEGSYPLNLWASVFFDNAAIVYLRRIPENRAIIDKYEYRFVRRGLPANYGAVFGDFPESFRGSYELEIDRCLKEVPNNSYCLLGKSSFHKKRNEPRKALDLLLALERQDPKNVEAKIQISHAYQLLGDAAKAREYEREFERMTGATSQDASVR